MQAPNDPTAAKLHLSSDNFLKQLKPGYSYHENKVGLMAERAFSLAETVKGSFGPLGTKIMLVNRLQRIYVTGSCNKFFEEIEFSGPDMKILIDGLKMQYEESGDGCKLFLIAASEMIKQINYLLMQGITKNEILNTYYQLSKEIPKFCEELVAEKFVDFHNKERMLKLINNVVSPNVVSNSEFLSSLVYDACIKAMFIASDSQTKPTDFNQDCVKVCQIAGGSIRDSFCVSGLFLDGKPEGQVLCRENAKIAVFSCGFDFNHTEANSAVVFNNAQELADFSAQEEVWVEKLVKKMADAGIGVVVSSGKAGDLMIHFANKYNIMVVNVSSKFMMRRIAVSVGALVNVTMHVPSQESLGRIDKCEYQEINEQDHVSIIRNDSPVSTIILYGTTKQLTEMGENGISSGVNFLKMLARDPRLVAGAGAFELSLGAVIREYGKKKYDGDIKMYITDAVANAFENIPKFLIENSGNPNPDDMILEVFKLHKSGKTKAGAIVECEGLVNIVEDVSAHHVLDALYPKLWAIRYAFGAIEQMCRVNSIIMARAGDFKHKQRKDWDDDDKI